MLNKILTKKNQIAKLGAEKNAQLCIEEKKIKDDRITNKPVVVRVAHDRLFVV